MKNIYITVNTIEEAQIFYTMMSMAPQLVAKVSWMEYGIGVVNGKLVWRETESLVKLSELEGVWFITAKTPVIVNRIEYI